MSRRCIKAPPRFIADCHECGVDVGDYTKGHLFCTDEQLAELRSRAEFYADPSGPDAAPPGLKQAAHALLKALAREGKLNDERGSTKSEAVGGDNA